MTQPVALVTGASSGFGRVIAQALAAAGWRVYGASRRAAADGAEGVLPIRMDVDDDASVTAGVQAIVAREGRLDAVISNAGIGVAGAIEDTSTDEAKTQFETNFFGNHRVCRAALPHLRRQPRAHLVVIGSIGGFIGLPFQGFYSASKFALEGYCEALRIELRETSVRVTILEPGDFATGFTAARVTTAASGEGSIYAKAFARALAVMEADERGGADPVLLGEAVLETLADDHPPMRRVVAAGGQAAMANVKCELAPEALEAAMAQHFQV